MAQRARAEGCTPEGCSARGARARAMSWRFGSSWRAPWPRRPAAPPGCGAAFCRVQRPYAALSSAQPRAEGAAVPACGRPPRLGLPLGRAARWGPMRRLCINLPAPHACCVRCMRPQPHLTRRCWSGPWLRAAAGPRPAIRGCQWPLFTPPHPTAHHSPPPSPHPTPPSPSAARPVHPRPGGARRRPCQGHCGDGRRRQLLRRL